MSKNWNIKLNGDGLTSKEIIFNVMKSRGIEDIDRFLNPISSDLLPSTELHNIDKAKNIILNTIENGGRFLIYADVDLDGCCSAAIIYRYLKYYTENIETYINEKKEHGIPSSFDLSKLDNISTVIVVDSINDTPTVYKNILGIGKNLIVLDHHVPTAEIMDIADEICLVSSANNYANPHLSGSGVCWKTVKYIDECTNNEYANLLSDLAAAGIIGDVCDVGINSPENRYICFIGLNNLHNPALKQLVGTYEFTATTVSYSIAPLVNSANRMGHNKKALQFFLSDDISEITNISESLKSYREIQKKEIKKLYEEIIIPQSERQLNNKCLYFMNEGNNTFNGVVAGKAADDFCRPVMVLSKSPDGTSFNGSMRSVGIEDFRGIINNSGYAVCNGHESSAGVTIEVANFFIVYNYIEEQLKDYQFIQQLDVDIKLNPNQITDHLIEQFKKINKISGQGFKPLTVCVDNITNYSVSTMSNGKHLNIKTDGNLSFIKWNISNNDILKEDKIFSAVGTLEINNFRGKTTRQVIMTDYKII